MPPDSVSSEPAILIVGAPGTGVQALHLALQAHCAPAPGMAPRLHHREGATLDDDLLQPLRAAPGATTTLLMGLDLPCPAADRPAQEAADASLRAQLSLAGLTFRVVYGQGRQRVAHALSAIKREALSPYTASASSQFDLKTGKIPENEAMDGEEGAGRPVRLRAWQCEKCSDPECEHRLFTSLPSRQPRAG